MVGLGKSGVAASSCCATTRFRCTRPTPGRPGVRRLGRQLRRCRRRGPAWRPRPRPDRRGRPPSWWRRACRPRCRPSSTARASGARRSTPRWTSASWRSAAPGASASPAPTARRRRRRLIAHVLGAAGLRAGDRGQHRPAALRRGAAPTDQPDWLALELSRFQLHDAPHLRPAVGVLTNLAPNHLDRYPRSRSTTATRRCSSGTPTARSVWVTNADDPAVEAMASPVPGRTCASR